MEIRVLLENDAQAWWDLRLESLQRDPMAFGKTDDEHLAIPVEEIARRIREAPASDFYMGAFENERLIGMATFVRSTGAKDRHKGNIYGMYVTPSYRGCGVGKAVLTALLERARRDPTLEQVMLVASSQQTAAKALYASLGFQIYGTEPRGLKHGDVYTDEDYMVLLLS